MEHEARALLFDIHEACSRIKEFTDSVDFKDYESSDLIRSAVERQFINIGEALNRLKKADEIIFDSITDAAQIIGFRNILVHGYDVVSNQLVWEVVTENLDHLYEKCNLFLKEQDK